MNQAAGAPSISFIDEPDWRTWLCCAHNPHLDYTELPGQTAGLLQRDRLPMAEEETSIQRTDHGKKE